MPSTIRTSAVSTLGRVTSAPQARRASDVSGTTSLAWIPSAWSRGATRLLALRAPMVRFAMTTQRADGGITETDEQFTIKADMVLKAIGQTYTADHAGEKIQLKGGRIATDENGRTSVARVWAGGDCRAGGRDLTVEAVEHGKVAAQSIHAALNAA